MLVSIICGVYNAEKKIGRLIESLLSQTYKNIELIMVINSTSDRSEEIILEYKSKSDVNIVVYSTEEKLGAGGARKKGFELATGEYIAVVDCDDYVSETYIENLMRPIMEFKYDISFAGFHRVTTDEEIEYTRTFTNVDEALYQSVAPWAKLYKREFLLKNGIEFMNIPFGEDILFTSEVILSKPKIVLCEQADYYWENNPTSTSHSEIRYFPKNNLTIVKEQYKRMIESINSEEEKVIYQVYKYMIWYLLQSGRGVKAKRVKEEYDDAIAFLDDNFQQWEKKCYNEIKKNQGERKIVRIVLSFVLILKKLHLSRIFMMVYSVLPMDRFWPSL